MDILYGMLTLRRNTWNMVFSKKNYAYDSHCSLWSSIQRRSHIAAHGSQSFNIICSTWRRKCMLKTPKRSHKTVQYSFFFILFGFWNFQKLLTNVVAWRLFTDSYFLVKFILTMVMTWLGHESFSFSPTTGQHQVCPSEGGRMGLQKWSTSTDTQFAPTREVCGASARARLVHWVGWPVGVSEDLRAKLHVFGETEAAWGSRSSTGRENLRPWGPHITSGLSKVSPAIPESQSFKYDTTKAGRLPFSYKRVSTGHGECIFWISFS